MKTKLAAAVAEMEGRFRAVLQEKDGKLAAAEKRRAAAEAVHEQLALVRRKKEGRKEGAVS